MSALGHYRTLRQVRAILLYPPLADIRYHGWNVCFVPMADIQSDFKLVGDTAVLTPATGNVGDPEIPWFAALGMICA